MGTTTDAPVLVLADARSRVEERVARAWAAAHHPGAEVVTTGARGLGKRLDDPRTEVVPIRVVWNPPAGDSTAARLRDLVAVPFRSPWPLLHAPLAALSPDAPSVIVGESATCGHLRADFVAEAGPTDRLEEFVARRAVLACDRAERRLLGDRYKVPRLMVEQITSSQAFADRADKAAATAGVEPRSFVAQAKECLDEMVAVQSPLAIDAFRALTSPLHARAWSVEVDTDSLERLREYNKGAPLVFLPAHRSYVDPLVMAEVLHRQDFPRNHVLGGNNMSFWPFGPIGRRAGVVFIRRSFGDDPAYKFAIREYLGHLIAKRFNLEWYIEGGRTRTGKLRQPKYGLLRYLVDAVGQEPDRDVVLVPTSIMYEQQSEVDAVVAELTGAVKKREGAQWFARYLRDQRRHAGAARVTFGEPFELRRALVEAGDGSARLEKVAFRICVGINDATPVMTTSVVTFALLSTGGRALTLDQIRAVTEPLLDYLDSRGIAGPHTALRKVAGLRSALSELDRSGVVSSYDGGDEPVWSITSDHAHVAAFYRNGALHHLVARAILELGLLRIQRDSPEVTFAEIGMDFALGLRDLLKFEFFFSDKQQLQDELARELDLVDSEWSGQAAATPGAERALERCRTIVSPRVVRPILEAQLVLAEQLLTATATPDRAALVEACIKVGHQRFLQERIQDADSVSRELYDGAWQLAENRGLLQPAADLAVRRIAFCDEIRDVLDLVHRASRLEAERVRGVLHGNGVEHA